MDKTEYRRSGGEERFLSGCAGDAYRFFGCHFDVSTGESFFAIWAPEASRVSVVGDFNGWDCGADTMERQADGIWTAAVKNTQQGQVYKYAVTAHSGETVLKADPYAFHCETGPATGSKIWSLEGYEWSDGAYLASRKGKDVLCSPMSIYEMHIGSWRRDEKETYPWYRNVADGLAAYCRDMGYTHVELLPVTEYPYEGSWGYQVTGYFAPTSRYGTPQDFMYFVDTLHAAGIGVIMDWVPAHFPRDAHALALFDGTPLYERSDPKMAAHPDWGTLIFDYEKGGVRSFLLSSAEFFVREYHVDGLRVDAVTSMLYLGYGRNGDFTRNRFGGDTDTGAIDFLRAMNGNIRRLGAVTIAEESSAYPGITAPAEEGGLGFTFKWDMGYMHDTLDYFALDPLFRGGSHEKLTFSMLYAFSERFILAYSHDESVHGKKSMLNKMSGAYDEKFSNLRALYGWQYAHPGKKLNFMGSEFGQFIEWDYRRELDWFLLDYPRHGEMQRYVRELNRLYTSHPALYAADTGWNGCRWLNVDDRERSCIALMRMGGGEKIVCACNFTPKAWELQIGLPEPGELEKILSSDEYRFGGTGMETETTYKTQKVPFLDMGHSALIRLPPLSANYYLFREAET